MGREENLPAYEDTHSSDGWYSQRLRSYQENMGFNGMPGAQDPMQPPQTNVNKEVKSLKNLMMYEPRTEQDSVTIIDSLKRKEPSFVNLNKAAPESAQRILDFSSGAVYALGGQVHKIADKLFLLLPHGIEMTNFDRGDDE